jgi:DNA-directed RNA polymerase subunit RPC12/RpoP
MALSPFYIGNENLSKEFIKWAATALNEKWERDLGKPARWNFSSLTDEIDCPYCGHLWFVYEDGFKWETWNYCPHCGKRLLPPEEINNE